MRAFVSVLIVLFLTGSLASNRSNSVASSSQAETPDPYALRSVFPKATRPTALVYPPRSRGTLERRSPAIAGALEQARGGEELFHVGMSADAVIRPDEPVTSEHPLRMAIVPKNDFQLLPAQPHQSARSITQDPAHREPALIGSPHYGTVIGTFDPAQLCADCFVVLYRIQRREPSGRSVHAAWARITAADLAVLQRAPESPF